MNEAFNQYLEAIALPRILKERVATISDFYEPLCPEPLADILITDFIADEEGRRFENLWFFSDHYLMEAKLFASQDNFDLSPIPRITRWAITKHEYDFQHAGALSRMTLEFHGPHLSGTLRATGENCDFLRDVFTKYIVPGAVPE